MMELSAANIQEAPPGRHVHPRAGFGLAGLRLAHLILDMGFGGAERLAQDITLAMHGSGSHCRIICFDSISGDTDSLSCRGIPVELIKRRKMPFDPLACLRLIRSLRANGVRLVHAHDLASLAYGVAAGLVLGIPAIMTEHSRHYIQERKLRRLEKRVLSLGAAKLVEVSPELAGASLRLDAVSPKKVTVIENGVDVERFARADGGPLRTRLSLDPGDMLVGMVGRLEEIKGPGVLLEAFAGLAGEFPRARLAFVGEGRLDKPLRARAQALGLSGRVDFLGSRGDIPSVMAALDILALPSLSEGLPFALLEAMASGKAVAASAVGRVPAILRPESGPENGLLVPPGAPNALASALATLLNDNALRERLGRSSRQFVRNHHNQQAMLESYQALYRHVLGEVTRT